MSFNSGLHLNSDQVLLEYDSESKSLKLIKNDNIDTIDSRYVIDNLPTNLSSYTIDTTFNALTAFVNTSFSELRDNIDTTFDAVKDTISLDVNSTFIHLRSNVETTFDSVFDKVETTLSTLRNDVEFTLAHIQDPILVQLEKDIDQTIQYEIGRAHV